MNLKQPTDGFLKGVNARLKSFEQKNTHQAPQIRSGPLQADIGLFLLLLGADVVPQAITRIGQFPRRGLGRFPLPGLAKIAPQLLVKTLVGVFDAVFNGLKLPLREELVLPADEHISLSPAVEVFLKETGINGLMRLCVETVPTQDMVARAPDEDVGQQIRQFSLPPLDQFEKLFQVWRVNGNIRSVVLMEKLDLVVNVPGALVPGRGGQESSTGGRCERNV